MNHSAHVQRCIDQRRWAERLSQPEPYSVFHLKPLQGIVYTDNNQMVMYRDGLFMDAIALAPWQAGELNISNATWGLYDNLYS